MLETRSLQQPFSVCGTKKESQMELRLACDCQTKEEEKETKSVVIKTLVAD